MASSDARDGTEIIALVGDKRRIGRQVRKRREALGLSQAKLAGKAGVTQATISWLEAGMGMPSFIKMMHIYMALDGALGVVFGDVDGGDGRGE